MPIFDFVCNKCSRVEEKLVSRADADNGIEFPCDCEDGAKLERSEAISAAALRFKGQWFGTTGNY